MRLLVLTSFYPPHHLGGYEIACRSAVEGLRGRGHHLRVLTSRFRVAGRRDGDGEVDRRLHLFWEDGRWTRPGLIRAVPRTREDLAAFRQAVRTWQPDAVWTWHMSSLSKALLADAGRARVPIVLALADLWPEYDLGDRDPWFRWRRGWRAPIGRVVGMAAGLPSTEPDPRIAAGASYCSEWLRRRLVMGGLTPDGPVIPPGIDLARFRPTPLAERTRRFLHMGRLEPRKGPDVVIHALARSSDGMGDASVTFDGPAAPGYRDELRALADRLGVAGRVRFQLTERADDLPAVYASHDALVHAATWDEPFGMVLAEAMACGRPIVASPTGGAKEFVEEGRNALTFPPGDPDACARRMHELAADPSLARRLAEAGQATAARFAVDDVVEAHERHLRTVVRSSAA